MTTRWYPRLWWDGLGRHDAFSVKVDVPEDVTVAASGRLDPKTGCFEAAAAATFGLYLAKGLKMETREVEGVRISSYFTDKGAKAAALICYKEALKLDPGMPMTHSQWGMTIDRAWVEDRLAVPFTWKKR